MSWQDELRRLDEERAAGRLSDEAYQRRRAELSAQRDAEQAKPADQGKPAEPGGAGAQGGGGAQDNPPPQDSVTDRQAGRQRSPFPPAFRWDTGPPNETTEVIRPGAGGDAERTQVVPGPGGPPGRPADRPQPAPAEDDSERTQVVQAGPPAPPPYQQPPYQQGFPTAGSRPDWAQRESAPPWVSADLPPIQEPNANWMVQGPEFFAPENKEPRTMRMVAVAAAVVILLGIGIAAFFLFRPGGSNLGRSDTAAPATTAPAATTAPPTAATTGQPSPEPSPPPSPPAGSPIADLPGRQEDTSLVHDFTQVPQLGTLTDAEQQALARAGASRTAFALSRDADNKLDILVVQVQNPTAARDELADLQLSYALAELPGLPAGVRGAGGDQAAGEYPVLRRAHYAAGDYVVRVEVSGTNTTDVERLFQQILTAQRQKLPADE
ncbi:MAG TPA: SHOCT domain-containing protein [Pseudonocardiaceae bacterium]|nr:SHOCT domain-containing protein [Pseudonocardiaceae bacterium]